MNEWVRLNFGTKFKTGQLFDLSKRIHHYARAALQCLALWEGVFGECDFEHAELSTLATVQNLHVLGKIAANFLVASYSPELV